MKTKVFYFGALCVLVALTSSTARAQEVAQGNDAIKLEYKFKVGELLRYSLDTTMDMVAKTDVAGA